MNRKLQASKYIIFDLISAASAWSTFFFYRKTYVESQKFGYKVMVHINEQFLWGLLLIPFFWMLIYALLGTYSNVYRKSRLKELSQTFTTTILGVTGLFFALILDDEVLNYTTYYQSYAVLFGLHFGLTFFFRFILSSITASKIHSRKIGFPTLMIGSDAKALELYDELESQQRSSGNNFVGFIRVKERENYPLEERLPFLGKLDDLPKVIKENAVEDVIIALESSEHESLENILNRLENDNLIVKVIPDMYDFLSGSVRMDSIYGTPLIQVTRDLMPPWQRTTKRIGDVVISSLALLILSPLYIFTMLAVKFSSPGAIFYMQERIGKGGKPFNIIKFRSMFVDAEKQGPALSSDHDPRITPFGRFMRKVRLDEIPQFYNVLIGEMSLVGPRPERQFFIDQIVKKAPHYHHLHKVKPGITSWGMVKYGYAENVDEMIRRMKFDLLYIENMSLMVDIKILIYTVQTVLLGRGK
ncbi:MAG: exopolysaccharide biosynthesis polyprenyl glycosylphosphotransferase [Bacteroidia bacterium]|jgi:exopolysaccharide biosynthesis polyprenyl glycosylphosphotransferase